MTKYKVSLVTTASTVIEVEADSADEARDLVWDESLPYAGAFDNYEFGDWGFASELGIGVSPESEVWEDGE